MATPAAGTTWRARALGAGLRAFGATGLPRLAAPVTRGAGVILMLHHVRPWVARDFAPNRGLEITPEFLDETLLALARNGFELASLDDVPARLAAPGRKPFAALAFDDGYRDNLQYALPILERHKAPFTINVATSFADGTGRLWWLELEETIRRAAGVAFEGEVVRAASPREKAAAFAKIYWRLRAGGERRLLDVIAHLARVAGVDTAGLTPSLCMNWDEIAGLASHPLCAIGAHTVTHPRLAKLDAADARREMAQSKSAIEARIGKPVRHLAYPVGDATSAGAREFGLASEIGFTTAVTTRKGMVFSQHRQKLTALPRLSVNGDFQSRAYLDLLLTGAPFLLWNRGSRIAA